MSTLFLITAVVLLAWSNGANDNAKGVATLFGSGTTRYRTAIAWGTLATFLGAMTSVLLAGELLKNFSGKGLVPAEVAGSLPFLVSVAAGAGVTVLLASLTGFPISTTHALVGAIVGAGLAVGPEQVDAARLTTAFALPLLTSPLLAALLGLGLHRGLSAVERRLGLSSAWCLCAESAPAAAVVVQSPGSASAAPTALVAAPAPVLPSLRIDSSAACASDDLSGVESRQFRDGLHWLSAGMVSFARGLNDTPKIAALLLVLPQLEGHGGLLLIALAMALGGLLAARRVGQTMGHGLTRLDPGRGLAANLATGLLVIGASSLGMPVSTTHVSVGALAGVGAGGGRIHRGALGSVLASWVVTLPCAALLAGLVHGALAGW